MEDAGRVRLVRWVRGGIAVACSGLLAACGGSAQPAKATPDTGGRPGASAAVSQPSAPSADWFEAHGPVLSVKAGPYPHSVQIADTFLSPDAPRSPAPQGLTHIQLLLKVTGTPGRPLKAPHPQAHWVLRYDGCKEAEKTETRISCSGMDNGSEYFTTEEMRARDFSAGVYNQFGDLKADTPYWIRAWQLVPENADLSRAQLCEGVRNGVPDNCIPLGTVRRDSAQSTTGG